jgi:hypothetical protein
MKTGEQYETNQGTERYSVPSRRISFNGNNQGMDSVL